MEHRRNEIFVESVVEAIAMVVRSNGWNGSGSCKEERKQKTP